MEKCPVCGCSMESGVCRKCGFDSSCYYEAHPTLAQLKLPLDTVAKRKHDFEIPPETPVCPVCGARGKDIPCPVCGYNSSEDPEQHPTLELITDLMPSASRRREEIKLKAMRSLCCGCGSTNFCLSFDRGPGGWQCAVCGAPLSEDQMKAQRSRYALQRTAGFGNPGRFIAAGAKHGAVLRTDGTVTCFGNDDYNQCATGQWTGIVAMAAGHSHTVGLRFDGTVVTAGSNVMGQCDVSSWNGIVAIAAGPFHTVGLRSDGTMVATGVDDEGQCNVKGLTEIVTPVAGDGFTAGIRADGTVHTNCPQLKKIFSEWRDIQWISPRRLRALKKDGSVITADLSSKRTIRVGYWEDIRQIAVGSYSTYGLDKRGKILTMGEGIIEQRKVGEWKNIIALAAGEEFVMGLRNDGTVISTMPWQDTISIFPE